jgi:hypothetical protein
LVVSTLNEVQRPWDWLIQSLINDPKKRKSKKSKGKRSSTHKQSVTIDEFPIKEETSATRVTRANKIKMQTQQNPVDTPTNKGQEETTTNRGNKSKPDANIDMFSDTEIKMEVDTDEDYNVNPIKTTVKHKQKLTSKKIKTWGRQQEKENKFLNILQDL